MIDFLASLPVEAWSVSSGVGAVLVSSLAGWALVGAILLVFGYFDPSQRGLVLGTLGGPLAGWLMIRYWQGKPPFTRRGPRLVR